MKEKPFQKSWHFLGNSPRPQSRTCTCPHCRRSVLGHAEPSAKAPVGFRGPPTADTEYPVRDGGAGGVWLGREAGQDGWVCATCGSHHGRGTISHWCMWQWGADSWGGKGTAGRSLPCSGVKPHVPDASVRPADPPFPALHTDVGGNRRTEVG